MHRICINGLFIHISTIALGLDEGKGETKGKEKRGTEFEFPTFSAICIVLAEMRGLGCI